jgi:hypothetical protein
MSVNEEFLDNQLDKVYEAGFKQSRLLLEGKGANTITSDALYKSKQAILKHFQQEQENESEGVRIEGIPCRCLYAGTSHSLSCPKIIKRPRRKTYTQSQVDRLIKQARADQLKKLWNATQHDIVPEGTPPRDMSEELHKMIKELEE